MKEPLIIYQEALDTIGLENTVSICTLFMEVLFVYKNRNEEKTKQNVIEHDGNKLFVYQKNHIQIYYMIKDEAVHIIEVKLTNEPLL